MNENLFMIGDAVKINMGASPSQKEILYGAIRWIGFVDSEEQSKRLKCPAGTYCYAIDLENRQGDFIAEEKFLEISTEPLKGSNYEYNDFVALADNYPLPEDAERNGTIVGITFVTNAFLAEKYKVPLKSFLYSIEFDDHPSIIVAERGIKGKVSE